MSKEELKKILDETGIKYKFHHFTQKELQEVELPIIAWDLEIKTFFADGIPYKKIRKIELVLYTDQKDWELEERLENILTSHGIGWKKTGTNWLQTESIWENIYNMEV